jgi:hypothetical protein
MTALTRLGESPRSDRRATPISSPLDTSASPPWTRPLVLIVAAFALYAVAHVTLYFVRYDALSDPLFGDFFAFWSFARFLHALPAPAIYDAQTLETFQHALDSRFESFAPYPYPPILLLALWPLGGLGYLPAYGVWAGGSLAAYAFAVAPRDARSPYLWLVLAAPTTLLAVMSGQNGLLSAALIIGGFRLLGRRPILAGAILGCLVFKPQLFVLLPLALLAGRRWRGLAGMTLSVLTLTLLSLAAFGLESWLAWLRALPGFAAQMGTDPHHLWSLMPTLTAGLKSIGVDGALAQALQIVLALATAATVWIIFQRGAGQAPRPLDVAALQVGVFLVTPYAFLYDMPMVTCAVAALMAFAARTGRPWRGGESIVLAAALLLPVALFSGATKGLLAGPPILLALFAVLARAGWARADDRETRPTG